MTENKHQGSGADAAHESGKSNKLSKTGPARAEIFFIGTSHISSESLQQIESAINKFSPTIVCVELDRRRLSSLIKKQKPSYSPRLIFELGLGGYLFAVIAGFVQQKLGNAVGTTPGGDMLTAVRIARAQKISVALIDQHIEKTVKRVSSEFGARTIFSMLGDFFSGLFFPKKMRKKLGLMDFSLSAAPSDAFVAQALEHLRKRYPGLYRALLTERNEFMVQQIVRLTELNPDCRLLVVVGAAHVPGMQDELRKHYKLPSERVLV